jgi:UDP-N-acetylglucosamine 2-epimerase (non-hydrolysing)
LRKEHAKSFNVIVLSTGQHREILKQTLGAFGQDVDIDLNVMTYNQQLGRLFSVIFDGISDQIQKLRPHLLVVQGDTTTSLAAALAAQYQSIPVAHVEAGLRSFDLTNPYPEELNRKVIDAFANLMFAPTDFAKEALVREGACEDNVHVTGNTGIDAFFALVDKKLPEPEPPIMTAINGFKKKHAANKDAFVVLVTMHRRENIEFMGELCHAVNTVTQKHGENILVVLPVHPNPNVRAIVFEKLKSNKQVHIVEPISYDIFPHVQTASDIIMTDSGGIQEEGASIGKPVILMRKTTERPEGVYMGSIQQVGVEHDAIVSAVEKALSHVRSDNKGTQHLHLFGDGKASERIGRIFEDFFSGKSVSSGKCVVKKRQDDIAAVVYKDGAKATLPAIVDRPKTTPPEDRLALPSSSTDVDSVTVDPFSVRHQKMVELTQPKPRITMGEIWKLPSDYSLAQKDKFEYTAIVSFYNRKGMAMRWLRALLVQTHTPKAIWITFFHSQHQAALHAELEAAIIEIKKDKNLPDVPIEISSGTQQLKYFSRFQLAMQLNTKYVAVFDDDCIPENRFIEATMHTINTKDYHGIIGIKGVPKVKTEDFGPLRATPVIVEADVVGGVWFLESAWVKLMFHDKMFTWETGEDWHLCSNARKYANLRSFVFPVGSGDDFNTRGFSPDYWDVSMAGDTTHVVPGSGEARLALIEQLYLRGDRDMLSHTRKDPAVLVYAENQQDMELLFTALKSYADRVKVGYAVPNDVGFDYERTKAIIPPSFIFNYMVSRDIVTNHSLVASGLYHSDSSFQSVLVTSVWVVGSTPGLTATGVVLGAQMRGEPIVNIVVAGSSQDPKKSDAIRALSTFTVEVPADRTIGASQREILDKIMKKLY